MRILVTGATGYVGRHLNRWLDDRGYEVRRAVRSPTAEQNTVVVGDIGPDTDWSAALRDVDVVVHTAARVHVMREREADSLGAFARVNTAATIALARQAAGSGVRRLVFLSSIKAMAEETTPGNPLRADDSAAPVDPYGISKHEAEQHLRRIAASTGLEVVIVRPVLVYGAGVKANFESMMRFVASGLPLPFGALSNQRSLVAVQNLSSLIEVCLDHPAAANEAFLVSDGEDLSTTELVQRLARAMGRPSRLLPIPRGALIGAARLLGRGAVARRLLGSLQVDIEKTRRLLGWSPVLSVDEALGVTVEHFLQNAR